MCLEFLLEMLQSHSKTQSHDEWSVANTLTNPTGFRRYIRVSWNCKWLKITISSITNSHLHGNGKLVKSRSRKSNNLRNISRKVCSIFKFRKILTSCYCVAWGQATFEFCGCDDGITYDVFSYFLCFWRKIRSQIEKLSMVWGNFCIVFIWVVIIHFYPRLCNFIGVLSLFSEKSCKSEK